MSPLTIDLKTSLYGVEKKGLKLLHLQYIDRHALSQNTNFSMWSSQTST